MTPPEPAPADRAKGYAVPDLGDRVALITGANTGLGFETARSLGRHGARLLLACRNQDKAERAAAELRADTWADVVVLDLDLSSLSSVEQCAQAVLDREARLDLLINNAGLMAVDESRTEDGFEMQIGVNHLGHFALTARLAPLVLATPGSRIVTMSSMGHRMGSLNLDDLGFERRRYNRWLAYFQSKLANLLFTAELDRRLRAAGSSTLALAAHPGVSATELGHEGGGITNKLTRPFMPLMPSAAAQARPMVRAATDPDARGGTYYGPRWMIAGRPTTETPSRRARRPEDAAALWQRSEELTGCSLSLDPTMGQEESTGF